MYIFLDMLAMMLSDFGKKRYACYFARMSGRLFAKRRYFFM